MRNNESTLGAQGEEKAKKMTRAQFMVKLDEANATLEKQIAQARENQREIKAKNEELSEKITATHERLLKL